MFVVQILSISDRNTKTSPRLISSQFFTYPFFFIFSALLGLAKRKYLVFSHASCDLPGRNIFLRCFAFCRYEIFRFSPQTLGMFFGLGCVKSRTCPSVTLYKIFVFWWKFETSKSLKLWLEKNLKILLCFTWNITLCCPKRKTFEDSFIFYRSLKIIQLWLKKLFAVRIP